MRVLATTAVVLLACLAPAAAAPTPLIQEHAEVRGIALGVELGAAGSEETDSNEMGDALATGDLTAGDLTAGDLTAGNTVRLRLDLRDTASGTPLGGAEPAAWMSRRRGAEAPECGERIARYLTGDLFSRADVDFNVYYILALNHDATLSVVDPLFGFGGSRVLALVLLESQGVDWALAEAEGVSAGTLFVSQPEAGKVAKIRTDTWRLESQIAVAPGVSRLRLQDDGAFLWALHPGGLAVLDPASGEIVARVDLDGSPMDFVFDHDGHAFALLPGKGGAAGAVAVVDLRRREVSGLVATGPEPQSIDWSSLGEAAWVSHRDGSLLEVDLGGEAGRPRLRRRLETHTPLGELRFAPGGRLGFAVSKEANRLHVFDAARGRVIQSGPMAGRPDQLAFSDELAYVRDAGSEQVLMVPLDGAGQEGQPIQAADFPGGSSPLGHDIDDVAVLASSFDKAPGAGAMVVANAADRAIYFYMEGMAAPMGHFTNQGRRPLAVKVIDRSLRPSGPGAYETFARLEGPGIYDVAVFLDAPRLMHCFAVEVGPNEAEPEPLRFQVRLAENGAHALPGGGVELALEMSSLGGGEVLAGQEAELPSELVLLVQRVAGGWHRRLTVQSTETIAPGDGTRRFRAQVFPGLPGEYLVWAETAAGSGREAPVVRLRVPAPRATAP